MSTTARADLDDLPGPAPGSAPASGPAEGHAGRTARRVFLAAAPVLAGVWAVVGAAADPAVGQDGRPLLEAYAANPDALQWKSVGLHFAYACWIVPALLIAPLVRSRGVWLANVAGFLGWLGLASLPGLVFVDFYDSAIGQAVGVDAALEVQAVMEGMWGIPVFALPGIVGFVVALPLAVVAAWRAGLVRWWAPAAAVAAFAMFPISGVAAWGMALATVFMTVLAVALWRATATTG